jgi:hypothetical protein
MGILMKIPSEHVCEFTVCLGQEGSIHKPWKILPEVITKILVLFLMYYLFYWSFIKGNEKEES